MFESVAHRFLAHEEFPITWSNGATEIVSHGPLPIHSVDADLNSILCIIGSLPPQIFLGLMLRSSLLIIFLGFSQLFSLNMALLSGV